VSTWARAEQRADSLTGRKDASKTSSHRGDRLRRTTGALFVAGAVAFAAAATTLSAAFDWPDILREPADVVLPSFADGGTGLVWTWFATA
jgi:hypothetical protein